MAQLPNAAEDDALHAQPTFLGETGQDVPEGTFATTDTPTTTGTVGGEAYRLGPTRGFDEHPNADIGSAVDAATLLGLPTMSMEEVGAGPWLRKLAKGEVEQAHEGLRYALRAANRIPDQGPQDIATRGDLIQAAAGKFGNYHDRLTRWLANEEHLFPAVKKSLDDFNEYAPDWPKGTETWAEHGPKVPEQTKGKSLYERLFGRGKKGAPRSEVVAGPEGQAETRSAYTPVKHQSPLAHLAESVEGTTGADRKAGLLKDFTTRRELAKLGWKGKDLEGLPAHRVQDILNRNIENTGQAEKWLSHDAGKKAYAAGQRAHELERKELLNQGTFPDWLRNRGETEFEEYPLEKVKPGEQYPLKEHGARQVPYKDDLE
jgi:hypothetical protein